MTMALATLLRRCEVGALALRATSALTMVVTTIGAGCVRGINLASDFRERSRFFALSGLVPGSMFVLLVVTRAIPAFVLPPCE